MMRVNRSFIAFVLFLALLLGLWFMLTRQQTPTTVRSRPNINATNSVLILYGDATPQSEQRRSPQFYLGDWQTFPYKDAGLIYATLLQNLLGHFEGLELEIKAISDYKANDAFQTVRTFYIGSSQNEPLPAAFLKDVLALAPVTWIGFNSEQLNTEAAFKRLGMAYATHFADYEAPFVSFSNISYKGFSFEKNANPMDLVGVSVNDELDPVVHAWAYTPQGERSPYALQKDAFWFIADIPFTYPHEQDRYLVFADLLSDMLGVKESCAPKALLRVEDVRPTDSIADLSRVFDVLIEEEVYFSMATIPFYANENTGEYISWADKSETLELLQTMQSSGWGFVFQHGTTHHTPDMLNPVGISGADWEFWDANSFSALTNMNPQDALERVLTGKQALYDNALNPVGFITPHYAAPSSFLSRFSEAHQVFFERRFVASGLLRASQFFPYPSFDSHGVFMLPENANYLSEANSFETMIETAKANRVLSCPWLGVFMHPYIFNPSYQGSDNHSPEALRDFIRNTRALGYEFVRPTEVNRSVFSKLK